MAMSEQTLQVSPTELINWALAHERAADGCATARSDNQRTAAAAASWGPMFHEARRSTINAVNAREQTLLAQEQRHRATAQQLRKAAAEMDEMNARNRAALTISTD
jgi:hypothetical protein